MRTRSPGKFLTVVIADDSRFIHLQEPVLHRSVQIELTEEQQQQLALRWTGALGKTDIFETVSRCFIEPPFEPSGQ